METQKKPKTFSGSLFPVFLFSDPLLSLSLVFVSFNGRIKGLFSPRRVPRDLGRPPYVGAPEFELGLPPVFFFF